MSTRGWYEYHVMDTATNRRTLAIQFFKWGDAVPEHALNEWRMLREQIDKAAFLFLIQRAEEEYSPFRNWDFRNLPKDGASGLPPRLCDRQGHE